MGAMVEQSAWMRKVTAGRGYEFSVVLANAGARRAG